MDVRGGKRKGAGRPKGEATVTKTFRFKKRILNKAVKKYGKGLNKIVSDYLTDLVDK